MSFNKPKKVTIIVCIILLFLSAITMIPSRESDKGRVRAMGGFEAVTSTGTENSYDSYLSRYSSEQHPAEIIRVEGEDYIDVSGNGFKNVDQYEGLDGKAVIMPDSGGISWNFNVHNPGIYNIRIHYFPLAGKSSAIERKLTINDSVPFTGADNLSFDRIWGNQDQEIQRDDRGNDLRPKQIEKPEWVLTSFNDSEGYYEEPYSFFFGKGIQKLSLESLREPMIIDYIELYQEKPVQTYEEVKSEYAAAGIQIADDQNLVIQAEDAKRKSSPTLAPLSDRSSPTVIPYDISKIRMNTIGGVNWKLPGQWIEWEVDAKEDGLYQLALKRKQDQLRGVYATRSITIDGEYPFAEMKNIPFNFSMGWQTDILGNGEEPYLFHLTPGIHRIRMTVTLGEVAPLLQTIESSVLELNEMYRKIIMITSNTPDSYRDYQLDKRLPDMIEVFKRQEDTIRSVADYLEQSTGERSDKVAVLYTMVHQLEEMVKAPETVARHLSSFKTNVGGLGTWILSIREQPLTLDYMIVSSPDVKLPRANATWWEKVKHEVGSLISSYTVDYDSIGNTGKADRSVTVWTTTGRDQAQIMKGLIDDTFTPETGISVNLRLVPGNILLPATLSGEGPDVAMQIGEDMPVNYAMRGAAADLTAFDDYDEIVTRFRDSALTPYEYNGGLYALPEQQTFPMLFFRKDILNELGLTPPNTWQDVYNMISVLQKHNMEFYLPIENPTNNATLVPNATFSMLLYQNGGQFYGEGGADSALDSDISMEQFKKWTQFYSNYKFPLQADFSNRFRTGEMPIGIADYSIYNMLTVLAPEIKGLWDFSMVPGTEQADGSISHEVASHTTGVMMLKNAADKDAAWTFMKWWTSKDSQVMFGRAMEGLLGEAARYPTANIEALEELPWPIKDYRNLESQWEWVRGIPQVPGGYFTGRHLDNAFRKVVNEHENPREALSDYILYINDEIDVKRKEFRLPNAMEAEKNGN